MCRLIVVLQDKTYIYDINSLAILDTIDTVPNLKGKFRIVLFTLIYYTNVYIFLVKALLYILWTIVKRGSYIDDTEKL